MHAVIRTVKDPSLRVDIVEQRTQFDSEPQKFYETYQNEQEKLQETLVKAQNLLPLVDIERDLQVKISQVCSELDVDGLRGDIVVNRASKALAALEKRKSVTVEDISSIITLCLRHRLRKDPLETIESGYKVKKVFNQIFGLEIEEN